MRCFTPSPHRAIPRRGVAAHGEAKRLCPRCLTHMFVVGHTTLLMVQTNQTPRSRPLLYWGLALGTIVLGFADLARGGETIAPILLVIGYCVLIPIAILK
jgi:hypothetical protein